MRTPTFMSLPDGHPRACSVGHLSAHLGKHDGHRRAVARPGVPTSIPAHSRIPQPDPSSRPASGLVVLHRPRSELMCLGHTHITWFGASSIRGDQDSDSADLNQLPLVDHSHCIINDRLRFSCSNSGLWTKCSCCSGQLQPRHTSFRSACVPDAIVNHNFTVETRVAAELMTATTN